MQYIEDKIGNEYKNWTNRNVILISAQTGTGKTSFILHTLLPFAQENDKHILYDSGVKRVFVFDPFGDRNFENRICCCKFSEMLILDGFCCV